MFKKEALLIIDMQKGSFTPETPRFDPDGVIQRINDLARLFRANHLPVIFIQHQGIGEFVKDTWEWEILDELEKEESDLIISKTANDAFYRTVLEKKLAELEVSKLNITGCATDFCVESTIQSALVKEFEITVVEDGHTTADRPNLAAENLIKHYNWVWANLSPTKGSVQVSPFQKIKDQIA